MSGGGQNKTTTVQQADPWEGQQPHLRNVFSQAASLYGIPQGGGQGSVYAGDTVSIQPQEGWPSGLDYENATVLDPERFAQATGQTAGFGGTPNRSQWPQYFPGDTVAGFTPAQQQALAGGREYAQGPLGDYTGQVLQASQQALTAPDIANNQYVQGAAEAAIDPVQQALQREVLPSITNDAIAAGQIGSSRQGVAEANALNDFSRNALNATSDIYNQAYQTGVQARGQALALAPETARLGNYPNELLSEIGSLQQAQNQREINADVSRWNYYQELPYEMLRRYRGFVAGDYGGESTTTAPTPTPNPWMSSLGGAATGAYAGSQISPGWGTAIGAIVGAGAGYMGSQ